MTPLTQSDINTAKQNHRELYYRVNILNYKMQIVDEIGDVVTDATFTIDSTSNIRRTATLDITPDKDEWYKIEYGSKLWGDKYVQIYIGIKDDLTQEVQSSIDTKANVVTLTTEEYAALEESEATNANTLYMITDAEEETIPQIQFITWEEND
jgi:hypothetical protein